MTGRRSFTKRFSGSFQIKREVEAASSSLDTPIAKNPDNHQTGDCQGSFFVSHFGENQDL